MLKNTFCHIPGVGAKTEQQLWQAGLLSWDALRAAGASLSARKLRTLQEHVGESKRRLHAGDADYFAGALPSAQHWRMVPEFFGSTAYVDIETTGLGGPGDYITTIALYDGHRVRCYVRGQNLDKFGRDVARYRLIVTYNGKCFDVPFLRAGLGLPMDQAHIDLRYVLASLGYKGGLKGCERQLGLDRGDLADVDGYFAVLLWRDYQRKGNPKALETLLAYNAADVVNLATLTALAYNMKIRPTPFADTHRLAAPAPPKLAFRPDRATIKRIQHERGWC